MMIKPTKQGLCHYFSTSSFLNTFFVYSGHYRVGEEWFLEGKLYEQFLTTGVECQIFLEATHTSGTGVEEGWFDCVVRNRQDVPIPHTALTFPEFVVAYSLSGPEVEEAGVRSDRLRLMSNQQGVPFRGGMFLKGRV